MTNKLFVSTETQTVRDYHDGETYGSWERVENYLGSKVALEGKGSIGWFSEEVEVSFEPKVGQWVFVVIVQYSSGDSFGNSSGNISIAGVYDTPDKAAQVRQAILEDEKNNPHSYESLEIPGEASIYPGDWKGYFESLEDVRIEMEAVRP